MGNIKKICIISLVPGIITAGIFYTYFFYYSKGWHDHAIQYTTIFWLIRFLITPFVIIFAIDSWKKINTGWSLIIAPLIGLIIYTFIFWCSAFIACSNLLSHFDHRNRNLFDTIINESTAINLLLYIFSLGIVYAWLYFEHTGKITTEKAILQKSLARSDLALQQQVDKIRLTTSKETLERLTIKSGFKTTVVTLSDIACIQAKGAYLKIITATGSHLMSGRLHELESKLPASFLRIHRSNIVNVNFIQSTRSMLNGDYWLLLRTGSEIRASRTYREPLKAALGKL